MFLYIYLRSIIIPRVLAIVTPIVNCFAYAVLGYLAYLWYSCWRESIARNLQRNPNLHGFGLHVIGFTCSFLYFLRAIGGALERVLDLGAREVIDKVLSAVRVKIMVNHQVGPRSGIGSHSFSFRWFFARCVLVRGARGRERGRRSPPAQSCSPAHFFALLVVR